MTHVRTHTYNMYMYNVHVCVWSCDTCTSFSKRCLCSSSTILRSSSICFSFLAFCSSSCFFLARTAATCYVNYIMHDRSTIPKQYWQYTYTCTCTHRSKVILASQCTCRMAVAYRNLHVHACIISTHFIVLFCLFLSLIGSQFIHLLLLLGDLFIIYFL